MAKSKAQDDPGNLADLQAFVELRDRVNKAIEEIEKLRRENAKLSAQVKTLEAGGGNGELRLSDADSPEELRLRIEGFITTIKDLIGEPVDVA